MINRSLPVTYEADSIIVAGSVKISPPYKVDNCVGIKSRANSPPDSLKFTKKLVCFSFITFSIYLFIKTIYYFLLLF